MAEKKQKEVKHLFGTSEKSDFILNMTHEGTQKLCGVYSIIGLILVALVAVPYYFTQNIIDYTDENGLTHYFNEKFIFITAMTVLIVGFIGFCVFLVANMKKLIDLKSNKSLLVLLVFVILSVISCITAVDTFSAIYGYFDRSEGLFAILGYCGFFLMGFVITADKWRVKVSDFIVGIGLFQAVTGILQAIPATAKFIPNFFENLFIKLYTSDAAIADNQFALIDETSIKQGLAGIYEKGYAASGFACSPHALAGILSVAFAVALGGLIFDESKKRRIFYGISAPIISAAALLTQTVTGTVGIGAGLLVTIIIAIVKAVKDKSSNKIMPKLAWGIVSAGVIAGVLFATSAAAFNDEKVIVTDAHSRLSVATTNLLTYHEKATSGESQQWIYPYLWDDGLYVAQQNPAFGVGPDNGSAIITYGGNLDRCYNEYIDIMQMRGIPCFICYVIFLIICIVKMCKAVRGFIKGENNWVAPAVTAAAIAYMTQAFFNISSVTSSPYLWITLGLAWSFTASKSKKTD